MLLFVVARAGRRRCAAAAVLASHDWWPVFSPDRPTIAFTRVNGQGRVFSARGRVAAAGRRRRLAQASSQLCPSWSPDGSHLAYQSGGSHLDGRDANGSDRRSVTTGLYPDWAPDAARRSPTSSAGSLCVAATKVLGAHGDRQAGLVARRRADRVQRSDGIYVVTRRRGVGRSHAGRRADCAAVWSPDGTRLAYAVGRATSSCAADPPRASRADRRPISLTRARSPGRPPATLLAFTADGGLMRSPDEPDACTSDVLAKGAAVGASFAPGDPHGTSSPTSAARPALPGAHAGFACTSTHDAERHLRRDRAPRRPT